MEEDLKTFEATLRSKISQKQAGVPTFFDNKLLSSLRNVRESKPGGRLDPSLLYVKFRSDARFVDYATRIEETDQRIPLPWELSSQQFAATQGLDECLSWRGLPLFKTVFDFALYPMLLWEVKPASIIELGSGAGASALWFADLLQLFKIDGRVYSVDLSKPTVEHPLVSFVEGDCRAIEKVFGVDELSRLPHPWIVIEDAHVNTSGILRHFSPHTLPGDYLIVEDSGGKRAELEKFDGEYGSAFKVDMRYTDFFGRNSTCSQDSIFVKLLT